MENEAVGKRVIEFFREVKKNYRRREQWSMWNPFGFATWHFSKLGSYPPTETGRWGPCFQLLAGTSSDFFWQYWAFLGRYFEGTRVIPGMRPWAVRNYTSVCSSPIGQSWNCIEQRTQGNLTRTESMRNVCAREKCAWEVPQDSTSETARVRH